MAEASKGLNLKRGYVVARNRRLLGCASIFSAGLFQVFLNGAKETDTGEINGITGSCLENDLPIQAIVIASLNGV
jgi:hypothetical protein